MSRALLLLAPALLLAGCAVTPPPARPAPPAARPAGVASPTPTRVRPSRKPSRAAIPLALPGLEAVIGTNAAQLVRLFGPPRLDVSEGDARKLQFAGAPCVLDAYLYPPAAGGEPRTTYLDARRPSDGIDVDRAACVAALRKP